MTEREQKAFEEWFEKEVRPHINIGRIANSAYFHYKNGWGAALEWQNSTPAEDRYGREPDKVKPLAQYLDEYLRHEIVDVDLELLEQALDAYQSTENVTIKIERNII